MNLIQSLTRLKKYSIYSIAAASLALSSSVQATIVQFETPYGNFEVNLYDQTTPVTVANFLAYAEAGDFTNTFLHRSVENFVVQGGGFTFSNEWPPVNITSRGTILNEPQLSNVRGTIAMAKVANSPNSATSQWFINLTNNSTNLDGQNGGFTVFGEVVGDGMAIVDQLAAVPTYTIDGGYVELPLQNYDSGDPTGDNLLLVSSIQVIDAAADTAANLNPPANIYIDQPTIDDGGGSGSVGFIGLILLGLGFFGRKVVK